MTRAVARTMKAIGAGAALAALIIFALVAPAGAVPIERVVSPGGIEAWLVRERSTPLVALEFAFRGGSSQDPAEKIGTANMAARLLDEGAGDLDAKTFAEELEKRAIEINFSAGRDYVRGSLRTLNENRDQAFDFLRLALTAPRFDAEPIERVRSQVLSGLQRDTTSPSDIASRRWWEAAFPGHPYGRNGSGTLESLPLISADDLKTYARRILARDGLKIAVVGDIDAAAVGAMVDRVFGALPAKGQLQPVPAATPQGLGQRIVVDLDVPQAVVNFGGPGIARSDPDFMAAFIVNHILGGGSFSSRLYREVREKRGLAYSVYDSLVWLKHTALMVGGTATRSDRAGETVQIIEQEIQKLAQEGPTAEELAKSKSYLKGSYALNLDTSPKIAGQLVQIQMDELGLDYMSRRDSLIDAVTLDDTRRVAKRLLDGGLLFTVVGRAPRLISTGPGGEPAALR
jgi:zinc protease